MFFITFVPQELVLFFCSYLEIDRILTDIIPIQITQILQVLSHSQMFFSAINSQQPMLEIQPNQQIVDKEVGGSLALTCRPNVPDPSLVSQLEWRNPRDRKLDDSNRANPVYVQVSCKRGFHVIYTVLMNRISNKIVSSRNKSEITQKY